MDENTRQRNRRSFSHKEVSDVTRRPRISPQSLSAIISHISSNPDVKRGDSAKTEKDLISKFSKFIEEEFEEKNNRSSDTMKFGKKPDTLAKVSDSFPKMPTRIRRRRHDPVYFVKDIPLPGEEPKTKAQPTNKEYVINPSKAMSTHDEAGKDIDKKKSSPTKQCPIPNDLQISLIMDNPSCISSNKESNVSTSPNSSCEERREFHKLPEEKIASQVKDSLFEPSPIHETPVTHRRNTSKDLAESSLPLYASSECAFHETPYSNTYLNHSSSKRQFRDYENKTEFSCIKERTDSSGKLVQLINYPNFRTPPPTAVGQWSIPSRSRAICLPVSEQLSRPTVHNAPWQTHSRSKSWNHPSTFSSREEKNGITSSNLDRLASWRKSQETSAQQDSYKDIYTTSGSPVSHWGNRHRYSLYDRICHRTRTHLQNAISRRSYGRLPEELRLEGTVTRATSSEGVSIKSSQTQQPMEPPCFYHLSPDRVHRYALRQRNIGANYSPKGRGNENFGYSSPISPYVPWTPPQMQFLPPLYLPVQEPDDPLEPNLKGHQLLGDSQLLRFSRHILGKHNRTSDHMRYLGLCVSGQTIQELLQKIKAKFYPVGDKIILMIGTNNFLQNYRVDDIINAWDELISHLLCVQSRRLLLLTVPPIPKLANNEYHWEELDQVNTFIKGYAGGSADLVTVADISSLFLSGPRQCCVDYFEKTYGDSDRVDLIHLNERGFIRLRDFLTDNFML